MTSLKSKSVTVLDDQDLWSLLNGKGPNRNRRQHRNMSEAERGAFIMEKLRRATKSFTGTDQLELVIKTR